MVKGVVEVLYRFLHLPVVDEDFLHGKSVSLKGDCEVTEHLDDGGAGGEEGYAVTEEDPGLVREEGARVDGREDEAS